MRQQRVPIWGGPLPAIKAAEGGPVPVIPSGSSRFHGVSPLTFAPRVIVLSAAGEHLRAIPAWLAAAMLAEDTVRVREGRGERVRVVILQRSAAVLAVRIGEPSGNVLGGVRFYRWRHLEESAARIVEHHPRCWY